MILEDILQIILESFNMQSLTIPQNYLDSLSQLLDIFGSLNYFIPVNTVLSCIAFSLTFGIVCGIIKVVINK